MHANISHSNLKDEKEMNIPTEVSLWVDEEPKNVNETITRQAITITAYERIIGNHCVVLNEYERKSKEMHEEAKENEKTVQELGRINCSMCSDLAKLRKENLSLEKEMRCMERENAKLKSENRILKSVDVGMHAEFKDVKNVIEQAKCSLLTAILNQ